ncbi:MAG: branched-chain amino acid ABC transporter permease [Firmicutes bacterium]|nr:branched-chain amino acid ABC transporter permease [Bacillota bacterium]
MAVGFFQMLVQQLLNGLSQGAIYALIALGYTMVYGIMRLINFAHGDVYMVGAFCGFFLTADLHWPFPAALVASMLLTSLLGMIIERAAYRPLWNAPRLTMLITAIGVSLFLENLFIVLVSPDPRTYPAGVLPQHTFQFFGGVRFTLNDVLFWGVTAVLTFGLQFFVQNTRSGQAMRAVSFDSDAASLMGIDVGQTVSLTFAVGSFLAGAAGVLIGTVYQIDPLMGIMPGLKAFVAAVLGGIGIIPGAVVGGLILGEVESLVSWAGFSNYRDAVAFIILILILLVRPSGLFGSTAKEKV